MLLQAAEADEVLDAEALQQLLGGSGFNAKAAPTTGGGWAGSSFWKYKSAAAAIARLGGSAAAAAKKAPAAGSKARWGVRQALGVSARWLQQCIQQQLLCDAADVSSSATTPAAALPLCRWHRAWDRPCCPCCAQQQRFSTNELKSCLSLN